MKKLITIPTEHVKPLLLIAAKEYKGNLHACIIDLLSKAIEAQNKTIWYKLVIQSIFQTTEQSVFLTWIVMFSWQGAKKMSLI